MNVTDAYRAKCNANDYVAEKSSQTNSKQFTIPTQEATVIGAISYCRSDWNYDPFKDIDKTGSINFPEYMQTKTEPARSDEEILKDIVELAKKHARQGTPHEKDEEYLCLMNEWISSISPDRKSILNCSINEIIARTNKGEGYSMNAAFQQVDSQRTHKKDEKELVDYLLETFKNNGNGRYGNGMISNVTKNGGYTTVNINHGGGMITILNYEDGSGELISMQIQGNNYFVGGIDNYSGKVTAAEFFDDNSNLIMTYDGNDLRQVYTKEEGERAQEMFAAYNEALRNI